MRATVRGVTTRDHWEPQEIRWAPSRHLAMPLAAGGVAATAAIVRLHGALHYAFWQDEVASARAIVEHSPFRMVHDVVSSESTPPLWYALGWLAHRAGASPEEIRLLSVAAGAALAAAVVVYARRLIPTWAAALAGLATALGYQFVSHGRELRAYELYALLSILLAIAVQRVLDEPTRSRAAALAIVVAAGSLTHYFFLLLVLAAAVSVARARARRLALAAITAGLVPAVAWTPLLVRQLTHHRFSFIGAFDGHEVLRTYWLLFARAQPQTPVLHELAPLALTAAVGAGSIVLARASQAGRLCAFLAVLPPAVAAAAWLAGARVFDVRNLIGAGPFAAVAVAALLARLRPQVAVPAACLCVALIVVGFVRADRVPPVAYDRIAAALVDEGWRADDPIVVYGNVYALRTPLEWYLPGRPALDLGSAVDCSCAHAFVIASGGHARRRIAETSSAVQYERSIVVARVDVPSRWPAAALLVARVRAPGRSARPGLIDIAA